MLKILPAVAKKTLGLSLIFNSIVVIISILNILFTYYRSGFSWKPYSPYLLDSSLYWLAAATALLNIAPAKLIGKVKMKRLVFHHYVYGFIAILTATFLIAVFAPTYILIVLMPSSFQTRGFPIIPIYFSLCFVYGGLTLIIDDIYDVSFRLANLFDGIRVKISKRSGLLQKAHLLASSVSVYLSFCSLFWYVKNFFWLKYVPVQNLAHIIFMSNLFISSLWGLKIIKGKIWLSMLARPKPILKLGVKIRDQVRC